MNQIFFLSFIVDDDNGDGVNIEEFIKLFLDLLYSSEDEDSVDFSYE